MADDFILNLVGEVKEDTTKVRVESGLKNVSKKINAMPESPLNIVATLNFTETQRKIEKKIQEMSKGLNLDVHLNTDSIKANASKIQADIDKTAKSGELLKGIEVKVGGVEKAITDIQKLSNLITKTTTTRKDVNGVEVTTEKWVNDYAKVEKEVTKFNTRLEETSARLENLKVKYKSLLADGDTNGFKNALNGIDINSVTDTAGLDKLVSKINLAEIEAKKLNNAFNGNFRTTAVDRLEESIDGLENKLKDVRLSYQNLNSVDPNVLSSFNDLSNKIKSVKSETNTELRISGYNQIKTQIDSLSDKYRVLHKEQQTLSKDNRTSVNMKALGIEIETAKNRLDGFNKSLKSNIQATQASKVRELAKAYDEVNKTLASGDYTKANQQMKLAKKSTMDWQTEMKAAGNVGDTIFTKLNKNVKQFISYLSAATVVMQAWRTLQAVIENVTNLDTAMVSLRKVTDETDVTYSKFLDNASKKAKELGTTITDLVNSSADFAKLGYSIGDASKLAEVASIFSNVGELDISEATKDIVTAMKSFNIEASNSISIIDKINAISNQYAVSAAGLGEGLKNSASALSVAGNSIDQTLSMLTAMGEVTQDLSEAGNSIKVLSLRLRGASADLQNIQEDTDGLCESTSKLREKIMGLSGVDIMLDENTFKSTYQIMLDISKVYSDLTDVNKASLLETIAGKQRANQISALLTQMGQAENVLSDSLNSSGSAYAEHQKWLQSIEAKTKQFQASVESLSATMVNSDTIKWFVDLGTNGVTALDSIIDKIGVLGVAFTGLMAYKGFNGTGRTEMIVLINMPVISLGGNTEQVNTVIVVFYEGLIRKTTENGVCKKHIA